MDARLTTSPEETNPPSVAAMDNSLNVNEIGKREKWGIVLSLRIISISGTPFMLSGFCDCNAQCSTCGSVLVHATRGKAKPLPETD
ncbi:hypothetical protein RRG08_054110 [Elysia crispata]|uniref:Uncharacterized protein n=1 Tax=Elysia crispata TaxID=231223 RepID=A0AAE0ZCW6_9GAST|nr:hypothetical protein RRG08_054110 [Elysia crispata]